MLPAPLQPSPASVLLLMHLRLRSLVCFADGRRRSRAIIRGERLQRAVIISGVPRQKSALGLRFARLGRPAAVQAAALGSRAVAPESATERHERLERTVAVADACHGEA